MLFAARQLIFFPPNSKTRVIWSKNSNQLPGSPKNKVNFVKSCAAVATKYSMEFLWKYFFNGNIPPTQKYRNIVLSKNIQCVHILSEISH